MRSSIDFYKTFSRIIKSFQLYMVDIALCISVPELFLLDFVYSFFFDSFDLLSHPEKFYHFLGINPGCNKLSN